MIPSGDNSPISAKYFEMAANSTSDEEKGKSLDDDLTAVLIQVTGSPVRLRDNLLALFRLLRPVHDQTSIELADTVG